MNHISFASFFKGRLPHKGKHPRNFWDSSLVCLITSAIVWRMKYAQTEGCCKMFKKANNLEIRLIYLKFSAISWMYHNVRLWTDTSRSAELFMKSGEMSRQRLLGEWTKWINVHFYKYFSIFLYSSNFSFVLSLFWLDILFCTIMLLFGWFYVIIFKKGKSMEMILISKVEVLNKNQYN